MSNNEKAYIYIMTNETFSGHNWVKIGYATNVESRRRQLSTTALPYPYKVYATYEIPRSEHLGDKVLHKIITNLNPNLRLAQNREFFEMTPEQAFDLLYGMAMIHNREDKLIKYINGKPPVIEQEEVKKDISVQLTLNDVEPLITDLDLSNTLFYCKSKRSDAIGKLNNDGKFVVLKNSRISDETMPSLRDSILKLRNNLIDDGTIQNWILSKDVVFNSSSNASSFVLGRPSSGFKDWKDQNGKSFGDYNN